jgi:hypothetical protein
MANDIIDINVYETVETVSITVNPNLTTVNINRQVPVGVNAQDLQSVTDIGANTTNGISIDTGDTYEIGISAISSAIGIKGESNETYGVYGTSPSATGVYGTSGSGYGVQGYSASGVAIYGDSLEQIGVKANSYSGTAMYVTSDIGTGLFVSSEDIGASIYSNGIGLEVNGNGTIAIEANLGNSNKGLVINSGTSSTGNFIELDKNGVDKLVVNQQGELTAEKLIKSGGTSSQILAADGSVITAGNNITITGGQISSVGGTGGGGLSVNYYLNGGTSQGTFGGSTYYEFSKTAVIGTGADFSRGTDGLIASFITDVADPSLLLIPAGNWNLEFFFHSSSAGGSPKFYVELYKYDGTTFTSIASNSATPEGITNGTSINAYFTALAVPETVLTVNDRLAIRVFVTTSGKTITLHTQNGHLCEVITTFTNGLTALNGLQAQVQNFATGTTGTDFAINSSGSTHTFNLPSASATARGVVTTASQTFAGDKIFTGAIGASNLSNTNTGDNATNTQYSGLATSKQDTLQSTVNIKSINGNSLLGSGDLTISGTGISSLNGLTGATQTFSVFTNFTGSPSFVSSGTNHQLRLPNAGTSTDYGLVTNSVQNIAGTKIFLDTIQIPVPAVNTAPCIVLGSAGGGSATSQLTIGSTTTYPNGQEMQYVKGITSSVQTQLNSKQATLIAGNGIDITSNTISTSPQAAYTVLANNTNATAVPTEQVFKDIAEQSYAGANPTWTGTTAPSGTTNHSYQWSQIGKVVNLRVNLDYATAGSVLTAVTFDLPSDCPIPKLPLGVSANGDVIVYGTGMLTTLRTVPTAPTTVACTLRIKTSGTYEINILRAGTGSAHKYAYATIQYYIT